MRLLDLFSGAGGCAVGYHRAGFTEIVGVDHRPMPRYPFEFVQGDALEYLAEHGKEFDAIHASPPCQAYSRTSAIHYKGRPELLVPVRKALLEIGKPWLMENVAEAPMFHSVILCGGMFGLGVWRHRRFESSHLLWVPEHRSHRQGRTAKRGKYDRGQGGMVTVAGHNFCPAVARKAMGIDWMTGKELAQAIPPAFTEFLGKQLIRAIQGEATNGMV